jgi:ABC-type antimicrobial peptide transport system permease subunit
MVSATTSAVHQVDPNSGARHPDHERPVSQFSFSATIQHAAAGRCVLALILAAMGIYSVLSYSVKRRVQEIGIRLALGARLADVLRMVVVEGMKPVFLGVALGIAGAFALGRVLTSLIYAVKPSDPITFFSAAALLALISLCACMIPAYRATRVDPMAALRYE